MLLSLWCMPSSSVMDPSSVRWCIPSSSDMDPSSVRESQILIEKCGTSYMHSCTGLLPGPDEPKKTQVIMSVVSPAVTSGRENASVTDAPILFPYILKQWTGRSRAEQIYIQSIGWCGIDIVSVGRWALFLRVSRNSILNVWDLITYVMWLISWRYWIRNYTHSFGRIIKLIGACLASFNYALAIHKRS